MDLFGPQIAFKLYQYSASLWEKVLGNSGPLLDYYEKEWLHESSLYTSIFTLSLIAASKDFDAGAITEYSDIDVVWCSKLPTPLKRGDSYQRQVPNENLLLLSEIEMQDREIKAIMKLHKFDENLRKQGLEESWKVLITYRPAKDFLQSIPAEVRSPMEKKWLIITEATFGMPGVWLQYHMGSDAFSGKPVSLGP